MENLERLRQELQETNELLSSPRVKYLTRWVLENLRDELQSKISQLEAEGSSESLDEHVA